MKATRFSLIAAASITLLVATSAQAAVFSIAEFLGDATETFENIAPPGNWPGDIFEGAALMRDTLAGDPVITFNLSDFQNNLPAYDGTFMGLTPTGWTRFTFDTPVERFGGYFAHLTQSNPGGTITFFDDEGGTIETQPLNVVYNQWNWFGWQSDEPIKSILINTGPNPGTTGVYDNLQISYVPAPGALGLFGACAVLMRRRRR